MRRLRLVWILVTPWCQKLLPGSWFDDRVPSGNLLHSYGKWLIYRWFSHKKIVIFENHVCLLEATSYVQASNCSIYSALAIHRKASALPFDIPLTLGMTANMLTLTECLSGFEALRSTNIETYWNAGKLCWLQVQKGKHIPTFSHFAQLSSSSR